MRVKMSVSDWKLTFKIKILVGAREYRNMEKSKNKYRFPIGVNLTDL